MTIREFTKALSATARIEIIDAGIRGDKHDRAFIGTNYEWHQCNNVENDFDVVFFDHVNDHYEIYY